MHDLLMIQYTIINFNILKIKNNIKHNNHYQKILNKT